MREPDAPPAVPETIETRLVVERRPLWQRVALWFGIGLGTLVVLLGLAVLAIDTQPGHAFLVRQINGYALKSGLNFRVGRIDGSLYGAMVLRNVEVRDTKGTFATSPELHVDWRPFSYLRNRIDVRALTSPSVSMARLPALKPVPSDPNAPILPDINLDIAKLEIGRLDLAPAVAGQRHIAQLAGSLHLSDGRAQVTATGGTIAAPGVAGGDRVALRLDAVPDQNKLDIGLKLDAPQQGLVAGLMGLKAPLTLSVDGKGSWKDWRGRAVSKLGGAELANLAIQAQNGTFHFRGPTHPGLYMKGPVERLAAPQLDVALDATWRDRTADTRLQLRSDALAVDAAGLIDLARSRFGNFKVDAQLLTPGAIAPNLKGRSVRASVALDGPFARPVVDYKLQAAALAFGDTGVEQLYAEGRARVDADRILVPVKARAARVTGLNAAMGGLVTNLTVSGDLAISGDQILSDNLKLSSDRVNATAVIAADMGDGRYTGALKGRINDYLIDGVGIVNVSTDAKLFAAPGGGWGISGHVAGTSVRLFNHGVRNFLGGNAVASARVALNPKGVIDIADVHLKAPQFRITNGWGRYDPKGPILINADAYSTKYGPLTARVTGTMTSPAVLLRAARPGLGVGLANLTANVKGQNGAYAVAATGDTNYGPFSANVLVHTGGALAIDVRTAHFAGMNIDGSVRQTPAGPFAGQLNFAGSGVTGHAQLAAQGGVQRADVVAQAYNARIPGNAELTIGRALVNASVVLTDTPQVVADVQVAALRSGTLVVKAARAKIDYRGGSGTAQALAEGSTGVPFRIAANARMAPDRWLVALQGQGSGVNFHTAAPARIAIEGKTYRLLPTRIDFDHGSARVAGSYGEGMTVQTRLDSLDLAVVNGFVSGLGISGTATGSLDFTQPSGTAFPRADARLEVADFTRSGLATVSTPVNVSFVGKLLPDGGDARAIIRRGTTPIGRLVATLRPLGPEAGSWRERLMAAPLSGGIRYNGPAAVIFSLAGLSGQQLNGPIGIAADFSGRVRSPQLTGVVRAANLVYDNESYGTRLTNLQIDGRFSNDQFILNQASATAGDGTVSAKGQVGLSSEAGFPMNVTATFQNARLARSESLGATATGEISVVRDSKGNRIQGRLSIPEARYEIIRQGAADVPELTGIRRRSDATNNLAYQHGQKPQAVQGLAGAWDLRIRVRADNQLFVSGMGLESEWAATVNIGGTSAAPQISGSATVVRGTYSFAGRRFDLTRGEVRFQGSQLSNPTIDIAASTTAEGVTAILNVSGTAQQPQISFTSNPALPQDEVVSRLLFGNSVTNLSATEAIQLAAALNSLRGSGGGLNPLGKLRSAAGIDRLRILGADEAGGRGTALAAGKYITDDIYIEIITDARGFTATQLQVALTRALSVLSQTGSFGGSSVSVRYSKDY